MPCSNDFISVCCFIEGRVFGSRERRAILEKDDEMVLSLENEFLGETPVTLVKQLFLVKHKLFW